MKIVQKLANERYVKKIAGLIIFFCFLSILSYIASVVLCISGEEVYVVHTKNEEAINKPTYEQEQKGIQVHIMTAGPTWDIDVWTNENEQIDKIIYGGLILMFVLYAAVGISGEICLILIFRNLRRGRVFTSQNASYLLDYGLLQIGDAFVLPLINYIIMHIVNTCSQGKLLFRDGGQGIINKLVPCIVYIVAVYIIHCGFKLQDEVDHTI